MADYKPPNYRPSVDVLRKEFPDQTESAKFLQKAKELLQTTPLSEETFMLNCLGFLYERNGVSELTEFMSFVTTNLGIVDTTKSKVKTYEFVKGIPALSGTRIGYTFKRRGGLFFFLRDQGGSDGID